MTSKTSKKVHVSKIIKELEHHGYSLFKMKNLHKETPTVVDTFLSQIMGLVEEAEQQQHMLNNNRDPYDDLFVFGTTNPP